MNRKFLLCCFAVVAVLFVLSGVSRVEAKPKKEAQKREKVEKKKTAVPTAKTKEAEKAAAAQEPKEPRELAKKTYDDAKAAYERGDYEKALELFMAAYNYLPNPFVYISIAQTYDKLGKCQQARDYYKKYVEERPDAGNIPDIKEKIAELEARKGRVKIISDPEGARITINGETTDLVTPAELELQGGDHALALTKDGYIMETRSFFVPICESVEVSVKLMSAVPLEMKTEEELARQIEEVRLKEKKPRRKIRLGVVHYIAFGVAGAAAITAGVTGGLALSKSKRFEDKKREYEENPSPEIYQELEDIRAQGRPLSLICDATIGVAAVAAVTGIALLFVGTEEAPQVSVAPVIAPAGAGGSISVKF